MLTNVENYIWIIILPVFGLLFTVIWNSLKSRSIFPEPVCFVIALCVSILCVLSVVNFLTQEPGNPQEVVVVSQEDTFPQETQHNKFHLILLPYLALMTSFLLLLMLVKIGLLADGVNNFFRPSYRKKDKVTAIYQRNNLKEIKPK